nr:o-succinylbenzoate synthase [Actinomycetota bacterium]
YFERDLTPPFVLDDGQLAVPDGPGIGVDPLPDVLDAVTVSREDVT